MSVALLGSFGRLILDFILRFWAESVAEPRHIGVTEGCRLHGPSAVVVPQRRKTATALPVSQPAHQALSSGLSAGQIGGRFALCLHWDAEGRRCQRLMDRWRWVD